MQHPGFDSNFDPRRTRLNLGQHPARTTNNSLGGIFHDRHATVTCRPTRLKLDLPGEIVFAEFRGVVILKLVILIDIQLQ